MTELGKNNLILAKVLNLDSNPNLTLQLESPNCDAYKRIKQCLDFWIRINGHRAATIDHLIEKLKHNEEVLYAGKLKLIFGVFVFS